MIRAILLLLILSVRSDLFAQLLGPGFSVRSDGSVEVLEFKGFASELLQGSDGWETSLPELNSTRPDTLHEEYPVYTAISGLSVAGYFPKVLPEFKRSGRLDPFFFGSLTTNRSSDSERHAPNTWEGRPFSLEWSTCNGNWGVTNHETRTHFDNAGLLDSSFTMQHYLVENKPDSSFESAMGFTLDGTGRVHVIREYDLSLRDAGFDTYLVKMYVFSYEGDKLKSIVGYSTQIDTIIGYENVLSSLATQQEFVSYDSSYDFYQSVLYSIKGHELEEAILFEYENGNYVGCRIFDKGSSVVSHTSYVFEEHKLVRVEALSHTGQKSMTELVYMSNGKLLTLSNSYTYSENTNYGVRFGMIYNTKGQLVACKREDR